MAKVISIGNQSFESMRERNNFYVDKTLNMNMLECFLSNKYKGRGDLFEWFEAQDAINNLYDYLSRYFEKKSSFSLANMIPPCRKHM